MAVRRTDNSKDFIRRNRLAIIAGLLVTSEFIATRVRERTPVVTGNLKSGIKALGKVTESRSKFKTSVNASPKYAPHVEFGTSKMAPRAMFRTTINEDGALFTALLTKVIKANL